MKRKNCTNEKQQESYLYLLYFVCEECQGDAAWTPTVAVKMKFHLKVIEMYNYNAKRSLGNQEPQLLYYCDTHRRKRIAKNLCPGISPNTSPRTLAMNGITLEDLLDPVNPLNDWIINTSLSDPYDIQPQFPKQQHTDADSPTQKKIKTDCSC